MNKKLALLGGKILALGCNPKSNEKKERRKVQAGIFLLKQMNSDLNFHYRWEQGPNSPELSAVWDELRNHIEFFGLKQIDPPYRQKNCLRICQAIHFGPEKKMVKKGFWAQGLSALADLRGGDLSEKKMKKQIRWTFGPKIKFYFDELKITLQNLKKNDH